MLRLFHTRLFSVRDSFPSRPLYSCRIRFCGWNKRRRLRGNVRISSRSISSGRSRSFSICPARQLLPYFFLPNLWMISKPGNRCFLSVRKWLSWLPGFPVPSLSILRNAPDGVCWWLWKRLWSGTRGLRAVLSLPDRFRAIAGVVSEADGKRIWHPVPFAVSRRFRKEPFSFPDSSWNRSRGTGCLFWWCHRTSRCMFGSSSTVRWRVPAERLSLLSIFAGCPWNHYIICWNLPGFRSMLSAGRSVGVSRHNWPL